MPVRSCERIHVLHIRSLTSSLDVAEDPAMRRERELAASGAHVAELAVASLSERKLKHVLSRLRSRYRTWLLAGLPRPRLRLMRMMIYRSEHRYR
jgi:hypothetical protein